MCYKTQDNMLCNIKLLPYFNVGAINQPTVDYCISVHNRKPVLRALSQVCIYSVTYTSECVNQLSKLGDIILMWETFGVVLRVTFLYS